MELHSLQDHVETLTAANTELRRLLKKEQMATEAFSNPPEPVSGASCSHCASHQKAFRMMRRSNVIESDLVLDFQNRRDDKNSTQKSELKQLQSALNALQNKYDDLEKRKTDPFCRDSEIVKLRESVAAENQRFKDANHTAFKANCEVKQILAELKAEQDRSKKLETELSISNAHIEQLQDTIEAYKRIPELKDLQVGICKDWRCNHRYMEARQKLGGFEDEVSKLSQANDDLQKSLKRQRQDNMDLMKRMDENVIGIPTFQIVYEKTKPKVANLEQLEELRFNLRNLFIFFPAHDEEYDEAIMYMDFLTGLPKGERERNVGWMYAACHQGQTLPAAKLELFRKKSTPTRPEPVCRSCFVACMRAVGANFEKRGKKSVCVNVRLRYSP